MVRLPRSAPAGLTALLLARAASAQTADVPQLLPDQPPPITRRYTGVMEREQPGYEVSGFDLGAFRLLPLMKTTGFYDDNVFAVTNGKRGDWFTRFQPEAVLQSNWDKHEVKLDARGTFDRYATLKTESISDYLVTGSGRVDVSDATVIRAVARAESDHQSRLSEDLFVQTVRPLAYRVQSGLLDVTQDFGRLKLEGQAAVIRARFSDGVATDGSPYIQRTNNNLDRYGQLKLTYASTPSFGFFAQALYDVRTFSIATADTPKRDGAAYQLLGGVIFETSALMRGSIGVGYARQNFDDSYYKAISGLSFSARVSFFPTQLTTVTFAGDRSTKDSGIPSIGGYLSTTASAEIDHELLRSLILTASAEYQRNSYGSLDRRDTRITLRPGVQYRINRYMELDATYRYLKQRSTGAQSYRPYTDNRLMVGLTLRR